MAAILKRLSALCLILAFAVIPAYAGIWVWDSGAYRSVPSPKVWDSGAYRTVQGGWVWDAGAWRKFYTACTPVTHTYSSAASGSETIPSSIGSVVITVFGGGGSGGGYDGMTVGGGGGGGAKAVKTLTLSAGDWGTTPFSYLVGTTDQSSTASGTVSGGSASLTGGHGFPGGTGLSDGAGGSASGGDTNTSGDPGSGGLGGAAASGGGASAGIDSAGNPPGGGAGGSSTGFVQNGADGSVQFAYGC